MSEKDDHIAPQRIKETTQRIEVTDILDEKSLEIEREKSSKPPPIPTDSRRSPQSLFQIVHRLQEQGWTEIQFQFECSRIGRKIGLSIKIQAQFSYAGMSFEIVTLISESCQTHVRLARSSGSSQKQRIFTAQEVLGQGRKEDQGTTTDLERRILKRLFRLLTKIWAKDEIETNISFGLILDILTGRFSWQLKHVSSNDPLQNTHLIEGSYATSQSTKKGPEALLENLSEAIIRGIDPLYTLLGIILEHVTKKAIAKDLSGITQEEKDLITHPKTKIRTAKLGSQSALIIFAAQPKKPSN